MVADQFEVNRRRVQQLANEYRDSDELPQLETPCRKPYAEYPDDLEERILELCQRLGPGEVTIAHVLRVRDDLLIAHNRVHAVLEEYDPFYASFAGTDVTTTNDWLRQFAWVWNVCPS